MQPLGLDHMAHMGGLVEVPCTNNAFQQAKLAYEATMRGELHPEVEDAAAPVALHARSTTADAKDEVAGGR